MAGEIKTTQILNAAVTDAKLTSKLAKDVGRCAVGYIRFSGAGEAAGAGVDIGATEYAIAGGTAAVSAGQLVVLINAGTQAKAVVDTDGRTVLIQWLTSGTGGNVALTPHAGTPFLNTYISGGGGVMGAAGALAGGAVEAIRPVARGTYALQVGDAVSLAAGAEIDIGGSTFDTAPTVAILTARTTAGVIKSLNTVSQRIVNVDGTRYSIFIGDTIAVLADTDVVSFILM